MVYASETVLAQLEAAAEARKNAIRGARNEARVSGTVYYVSAQGDNSLPGTSPETAWRSLDAVNAFPLREGDAVLFRRGDLFRGRVFCRRGVTYAAYGQGEKPRFYGWKKNLADPALWECIDPAHHIYRMTEPIIDCGTLVFDHGSRHSLKLIPSCIGGKYVCREEPDRDFILSEEMRGDLDLFCDCRSVMTERPSHGETFPVPDMCPENTGTLYLRCDAGNPGAAFASIEALPGWHIFNVGQNDGVHIDDLCIRYGGAHAICGGGHCLKGLHVTNCEIGWIGGTVQHYFGTDPNYPQGTRGTVTRYGNGIEIYGGCEDYLCENNYIYQVYDAGVTHQFTLTDKTDIRMDNVRYIGNVIEYCVYAIEYFLSNTGGTKSGMHGVEIRDNFLRFSGYGWGQQRHNSWTPAAIKSWIFENPASEYRICSNVFDRCRYRLLHLTCESEASRPFVDGNTYVQTFGLPLGQFGAYEKSVPPVLSFFETSDADVRNAAGDAHAKVFYLKGNERTDP